MTEPAKDEEAGKNMQDAGKKMQDAGKNIQKTGCALTVMLTIPILLTVFMGLPGAIIGGIIFLAGAAGMMKKK
ncbi:MAG: hypothetical protein M0P69_03125 [Bacteroidales bacterium]|nr:hypothetical protein [Bacteroidales bacterium]